MLVTLYSSQYMQVEVCAQKTSFWQPFLRSLDQLQKAYMNLFYNKDWGLENATAIVCYLSLVYTVFDTYIYNFYLNFAYFFFAIQNLFKFCNLQVAP